MKIPALKYLPMAVSCLLSVQSQAQGALPVKLEKKYFTRFTVPGVQW